MTLDRNQTVAQIVLEHSECANVFQANRIDFCCKGGMSVPDACKARGIDADAVFSDLERAIEARVGKGTDEDFRTMSTPAVIAYVIAKHHEYLRRSLPFVSQIAAKVARVHGEHNPKLPALNESYVALRAALEPHLEQEEQVLFPALMSKRAEPALLEKEFAAMREEHLAVGALLEQIRDQADGFVPPEWACGSYRALMGELEAMEGDILRHVHLENHVLMPRFATS